MEVLNINNISHQKLGGKAIGLKKLIDYKVPVPEAIAIDSEFIESLIEGDSLAQFQEYLNLFKPSDKLAIRSSANNEDGNDNSFAGMYESVLDVPNDINKIMDALKKVYRSVDSKRKNSYSNQSTNMNVVIQKMIKPKIAGVCFTKAIDLNGTDVMLIEYVEGLGEKLVSGKSIAKTIIVRLSDMTYRSDEPVADNVISSLLENLGKIVDNSNEDLDIEWCVDENNNAFFVQARPITKSILIRPKTSNGAIASPGFCSGKVYVIDEDAEDDEIEKRIDEFPDMAILLAKTTDTNYVPAMKKAAGIITTEGSILSHAAIIARELKIPCITGFKNAFELFEEGNDIAFDTNKLIMKYNNNIIPFGDGKQINELELYIFENVMEEEIDGNIILVESLDNEFGIHIADELQQEEIDAIEIYIRKKYKKAPVILKDQKYLWYFEYKRFMKIPNFKTLVSECEKAVESFEVGQIENFVNDVCFGMREVADNCKTEYEKLFASEYAQATHFLINLYMCNGIAMKKMLDYATDSGHPSLKELLNSDDKEAKEFFSKIESVREKIWGYYVDNKWSDDDYFDMREEEMQRTLKNDSEDIVDIFYDNLSLGSNLESILDTRGLQKKKV